MTTCATPDRPPWNKRLHPATNKAHSRTNYAVDRDRIIHAETFRELQHKTQVKSPLSADVNSSFRTRLNHVIEVAQIARSLAREIRVDETMAEAIALAHDLGHPPFGHAGERALARALEEHGHYGWNANIHSLRVVDEIERSFIAFRGLNLTWATREGIARHSTPFDDPVSFGEFAHTAHSGLESQIVDASDVLAYISHDLDDALADEYISESVLVDVSSLFRTLLREANIKLAASSESHWPAEEHQALRRRYIVARLIDRTIKDLTETTIKNLQTSDIKSPDHVRDASHRIVVQSPEFAEQTLGLLDLLVIRYYRSSDVSRADVRAEGLLRQLFEHFLGHQEEVPQRFRTADTSMGVADYLVSLNDRTATALMTKIDKAEEGSNP